MRKRLTNRIMLEAAKRRLAEHLDTRPATRDEANAIRRRLEREAEWWESQSRQTYRPRTAAECGRGEAQHQEGREVALSVRESLRQRNAARQARMEARAWQCDDDDMSDVWERTRAELEERVDHYRTLAQAEADR